MVLSRSAWTRPCDQAQRVVCPNTALHQCQATLQQLSGKYEVLLIGRTALPLLDIGFDTIDGAVQRNEDFEALARHSFDPY